MATQSLRLLSPNGHLGFAPLKVESFRMGVETKPDFIIADSGSDDIGPVPLGSDTSTSPLEWQKHDLEHMLLAARELGVPMIVGSAGDTGTNSRVDLYVKIIKEIAAKHNLRKFKIGYFYSEVDKSLVLDKMNSGQAIEGLDGRPDLTPQELERTERIVAVAGIHPFIKLLDMGADVIIGGRCSDSVNFAAPAIRAGYAEPLAYYMGKVLECASFCAEPYGGKETVIGEITETDVKVTAMHPEQRCTVASVAGHAMYERSNPFYEYVLGGKLDMTSCEYEQYNEKTCRITGPDFYPDKKLRVKLEGAGKLGERYVGIVGVRDPYIIDHIDEVIKWARDQTAAKFGPTGYELYYNIYGKNGVMGDLEPDPRACHELCVIVQGIAPSKEMAEEVCMTGTRQMFYARLPETKGTAGGVAFVLDEVLAASPAYEWTLNHTMALDDPLELFPTFIVEAGV